MKNITTLGIDLAKNYFQLHGVDASGKPLLKNKLTRSQFGKVLETLPLCTVVMEACATAHYWGQRLKGLGHEVKLIAPQHVVPFRRSQKNDANDAKAIVEAALRPEMNFVPLKSAEQLELQFLHRNRKRLVNRKTALCNQLRAELGEWGIVLPQGISVLKKKLTELLEAAGNRCDVVLSETLLFICQEAKEELEELEKKIKTYEKKLIALSNRYESYQRLLEIKGVGPLSVSAAIVELETQAHVYKRGRQFAANLGLVPRQHSSGGKSRLGSITKRGDRYFRELLVHGARSVVRLAKYKLDALSQWVEGFANAVDLMSRWWL